MATLTGDRGKASITPVSGHPSPVFGYFYRAGEQLRVIFSNYWLTRLPSSEMACPVHMVKKGTFQLA